MRLEIELDLDKIDYDAINKQIQEKVANLDFKKEYSLNSKIDITIQEEVHNRVSSYMNCNGYRYSDDVDQSTKNNIKNVISEEIKETVQTRIKEIFNQIPQEELDKIIIDLIPKVLVGLLTDHLISTTQGFYYGAKETIVKEAQDRIKCIL